MHNSITRHLVHQMMNDSEFIGQWIRMKPELRSSYMNQLCAADALGRRAEANGSSPLLLHREAAKLCQSRFSAVPEMDFSVSFSSQEWMKAGRNKAGTRRLYVFGHRRLAEFLQECVIAPVRFYGGIKRESAVEEKIRKHRREGQELELWDLARFRIVMSSVDDVLGMCGALQAHFAGSIVRQRVYYRRPRNGEDDPYRAVHFEIGSAGHGYFELQLMTMRREAVGLLDHSLVLKRSLAYMDERHRTWLRRVSWMANVMDATASLAVKGAHSRRTQEAPESALSARATLSS